MYESTTFQKTFNVINYRSEGENNDRNSKPYDLKGRSLLKESDFTKAEFEGLIDFAITLKEYKKNGIKHHYLSGKILHYYSKRIRRERVQRLQLRLLI